MHWILQTDLFQASEWKQLVDTLDRFKLPWSEHRIISASKHLDPEPGLLEGNIICMGSYSMLYEAKRHRWNPGVYDLLEQDFTKQLDAWGERMLNSDSRISTLGDASISEPTFIRPLNDSKHFTGKLFEVGEFHQLQEKAIRNDDNNGRGLSLKTPLQLSGPKHILSEARVWVVDGNIVTQSIYKRGQTVFYSAEVDPDLIKVAQTAIDDWQPHKAFVIDVCDTDKGAKIVEINAINSAGFYAGDVQKIVMALEQMEGAF